MSLPSIAAVQSRIGAIEAQITARLPRTSQGTFAASLQRATRGDFRQHAAATLPTSVGSAATAVGSAGEWASRLPEAGRPWAAQIEAAATEAGVDPRLLAALTWAESGFRADAVSHAGARGLTQLMPGTAAGLGVDPSDPADNLRGGARYLRAQLDRFGQVELALAAYNAGPGRVAQAGGVPRIAETQAYVPRVLGYYQQLGGSR